MRNHKMKLLWFLVLPVLVFSSCNHLETSRVARDSEAVSPFVHKATAFHAAFWGGRYKGGTAFIDDSASAFWVKDGAVYVVNEQAAAAAPQLPAAPDDVVYDTDFIAAAKDCKEDGEMKWE